MGRKKATDCKVSLSKRLTKSGGFVYYARWWEPGEVPRDRWLSLETDDLELAQRKRATLEQLLLEGKQQAAPKSPERPDLTFQEAWAEYMRVYGKRLALITARNYGLAWEGFWRDLGLKRLSQLTQEVLEEWRDDLSEGGLRDGVALQAQSVNQYMTTLSGIWRRLRRAGVVDANPFAEVERLHATGENRQPFLTVEQLTRLIEVALVEDVEMAFYIALGGMAGLRPKERLYARGDWLIWQTEFTGVLHVPASEVLNAKSEFEYARRFRAKMDKARDVPVCAALGRVLRRREAGAKFLVHPEIEDWQSYPRVRYKGRYRRLLELAELGNCGVTSKNLRHSFASNAVAAGVNPYKVKEWMGHADFKTMNIYTHLQPYDEEIERIYGG